MSPPICAAKRRRRTELCRPRKAGRPQQAAPHRPPRAWLSGSPMLPATTKCWPMRLGPRCAPPKPRPEPHRRRTPAAQLFSKGLRPLHPPEPDAEPVWQPQEPACARPVSATPDRSSRQRRKIRPNPSIFTKHRCKKLHWLPPVGSRICPPASRARTHPSQIGSPSSKPAPQTGVSQLRPCPAGLPAMPTMIFAVEPAQPIYANLIQFPREMVATRKVRPRLAEGPLARAEISAATEHL